ncbi:MAG: DnaJ domain-containing protein [Romboutsia sp.]|uniref:J domain-containing protein n=1 Tax=Clostridium sp. DSM 8431 TaxID=1761781 RepID=UPI0008E08013|nr:DnaJ domain-containing protein [Clostridium sp. DSM 8431]MBQ3421297.1 DnaJ domain-containing protein [Romboutsia sp.]SFU87291.1 DnaJ domain-containing protein [Clostridium sp. DSM 8431]
MDNYEILGVSKDASMEEVKAAYEEKLSKIDNDVVNMKNAEAFKKILKDAYEGITKKKSTENTLVMTKEEFHKFAMKQAGFSYSDDEEDEESYYDDEEEDSYYDDEDDYYEEYGYYSDISDSDEYEEDKPRERRSVKYNKKNKRKNKKKSKEGNKRNRSAKREPDYDEDRVSRRERSSENKLPWIIRIPISIVFLPFILVFSVVLFIFYILDLVLGIIAKLVIFASVVIAIGYGFAVYKEMIPLDNRVFIICGASFIVALILLPVIRVIFKSLEILNNKLKAFVF